MKIILEFFSEEEMNQYIMSKAMELKHTMDETKEVDPEAKVPLLTRVRHPWTQYELNFLIDNYASKSMPWIAKSLHRNAAQCHAKLHEMRKKGARIPEKKHRNGRVSTSRIS